MPSSPATKSVSVRARSRACADVRFVACLGRQSSRVFIRLGDLPERRQSLITHTFTVSDEQYAIIARHALSKGLHTDDFVSAWIEDLGQTPTYYETDDWFRHLGATEEQILEARRLADERNDELQRQSGTGADQVREEVMGTADANSCGDDPLPARVG